MTKSFNDLIKARFSFTKSLASLENGGYIQWGSAIANVLMHNAASYTDSLIQKEVTADPRIKYVRLQPHLTDSEKDMDNVEADNIENLKKTALNTMLKHTLEIAEIIEDLVKDFGGN